MTGTTGSTQNQTPVRVRTRTRQETPEEPEIMDESSEFEGHTFSREHATRLREINIMIGKAAAKQEGKRLMLELMNTGRPLPEIAKQLGIGMSTAYRWKAEIGEELSGSLKGKVDPHFYAGKILERLESGYQKVMAVAMSGSQNITWSNRIRAMGEARVHTMDLLHALKEFGVVEDIHVDTGGATVDPRAEEAKTLNDFFRDVETDLFADDETEESGE